MNQSPAKVLGSIAQRLPHVEKGVACEGTSVERATFKANKKAFLFLGTEDAMVKLQESIPQAKKTAGCKVGASGWTKIVWGAETPPPLEVLKKWIEESYRLMAAPPRRKK
jgi:hypothetical protein